jgi:hypothetical protein
MVKQSNFIWLFSLAYLFTVGMLLLLQLSKVPWFIVWLVLMHSGIVMLAILKKRSKALITKAYFKRAYLSFGLFIPILIYKLVALVFSFEENEQLVKIISFVIIGLCLLLAVYHLFLFRKQTSS